MGGQMTVESASCKRKIRISRAPLYVPEDLQGQ
jgi:hypothetical protein